MALPLLPLLLQVSWASDAKLSNCTLDETVVPGKKLQPMVQDEFANYEDADQYILRLQKVSHRRESPQYCQHILPHTLYMSVCCLCM